MSRALQLFQAFADEENVVSLRGVGEAVAALSAMKRGVGVPCSSTRQALAQRSIPIPSLAGHASRPSSGTDQNHLWRDPGP